MSQVQKMSGCLHAFLNFSFLKFMKCMLVHKKKLQIIITFSGQIFAFWHWEDFKWFTWWKVVLNGWKGKDEGISRVTSLVNFDCYMVPKVKFSLPPSLVTNYSTTILHSTYKVYVTKNISKRLYYLFLLPRESLIKIFF